MNIAEIKGGYGSQIMPEFGVINDDPFYRGGFLYKNSLRKAILNESNSSFRRMVTDDAIPRMPISDHVAYQMPSNRRTPAMMRLTGTRFESTKGVTSGLILQTFNGRLVDQYGNILISANVSTDRTTVTTPAGPKDFLSYNSTYVPMNFDVLYETELFFVVYLTATRMHEIHPAGSANGGETRYGARGNYNGDSSLVLIDKSNWSFTYVMTGFFDITYAGNVSDTSVLEDKGKPVFIVNDMCIRWFNTNLFDNSVRDGVTYEPFYGRGDTAGKRLAGNYNYNTTTNTDTMGGFMWMLTFHTADDVMWSTSAGSRPFKTHLIGRTFACINSTYENANYNAGAGGYVPKQRCIASYDNSMIVRSNDEFQGILFVGDEADTPLACHYPYTLDSHKFDLNWAPKLYFFDALSDELTVKHTYTLPTEYQTAQYELMWPTSWYSVVWSLLTAKAWFWNGHINLFVNAGGMDEIKFCSTDAGSANVRNGVNAPPMLIRVPVDNLLNPTGPQEHLVFPDKFGEQFQEGFMEVLASGKLALVPRLPRILFNDALTVPYDLTKLWQNNIVTVDETGFTFVELPHYEGKGETTNGIAGVALDKNRRYLCLQTNDAHMFLIDSLGTSATMSLSEGTTAATLTVTPATKANIRIELIGAQYEGASYIEGIIEAETTYTLSRHSRVQAYLTKCEESV
jgi:hypothetical protein